MADAINIPTDPESALRQKIMALAHLLAILEGDIKEMAADLKDTAPALRNDELRRKAADLMEPMPGNDPNDPDAKEFVSDHIELSNALLDLADLMDKATKTWPEVTAYRAIPLSMALEKFVGLKS